MEVEQRSVIFYYRRKGKSLNQIKTKLDNVYGDKSLNINTIKYWIRQFKLGRYDPIDQCNGGKPPLDFIDAKIMSALDKEPFHSTYTLSETVDIPRTTIIDHLNKMGFKNYCLRVVPYELTSELKEKRIEGAKELLSILNKHKTQGFYRLLTGDESWFYLRYNSKRIWSLSYEYIPQYVPTRLHNKKYMLTVIWSVDGFKLINVMPEKEKFNSNYFIYNIIEPLACKIYPNGRNPHETKYVLHIDNARPHNSKDSNFNLFKNNISRAPHPPFSPDLAPSDFFLFGYLKNKLENEYMDDIDTLLNQVSKILYDIPIEMLKAVYESWMKRCEWVINHDGNYYNP